MTNSSLGLLCFFLVLCSDCLNKLGHLVIDPLPGTLKASHHIARVFFKELLPVALLLESPGAAYDDEAMLGTRDSHVNPVLFLDKGTVARANHRDEDEIELTSLGAIDGQDLVVDICLRKSLSDLVLLSVVRSDHVHAILGKLLDRDPRVSLVSLEAFPEHVETVLGQQGYDLCFFFVVVGGTLPLLDTVRNINEEEG